MNQAIGTYVTLTSQGHLAQKGRHLEQQGPLRGASAPVSMARKSGIVIQAMLTLVASIFNIGWVHWSLSSDPSPHCVSRKGIHVQRWCPPSCCRVCMHVCVCVRVYLCLFLFLFAARVRFCVFVCVCICIDVVFFYILLAGVDRYKFSWRSRESSSFVIKPTRVWRHQNQPMCSSMYSAAFHNFFSDFTFADNLGYIVALCA